MKVEVTIIVVIINGADASLNCPPSQLRSLHSYYVHDCRTLIRVIAHFDSVLVGRESDSRQDLTKTL